MGDMGDAHRQKSEREASSRHERMWCVEEATVGDGKARHDLLLVTLLRATGETRVPVE